LEAVRAANSPIGGRFGCVGRQASPELALQWSIGARQEILRQQFSQGGGTDERINSDSACCAKVVRVSAKETRDTMLDAEAGRLCRAERYERIEVQRDKQALGAPHDGKSA